LRAWATRYLPAWVLSTAATLCSILAAQSVTHNALLISLIGASVETGVYYAALLWHDVGLDRALQASYGLRGFSRTVLNLTLELGLAEVVDAFVTRPAALLVATQLIADVALAVVLGNFAADALFYVPAIVVYEARRRGIRPLVALTRAAAIAR
jgi:hypothetical protein